MKDLPKVIYICHRHKNGVEKYIENWKKLNSDFTISFFDNSDCEKFLYENFGDIYLKIFKFIPDGPIKADFWRLCILYKYGGVYTDIDNEPLAPISEFLEYDVDFCTCSSFWAEKDPYTGQTSLYNPNFIVSRKNNKVLKDCIEWYMQSYEKIPYSYWGWSIMNVMSSVMELEKYDRQSGIYYEKNKQIKVQILQEIKGEKRHEDHNIYKGRKIFNNRYKSWDRKNHKFKRNTLLSLANKLKLLFKKL